MIKPLRKKHLYVWITLAILIPAGIIIATISIRKPVKTQLIQSIKSKP